MQFLEPGILPAIRSYYYSVINDSEGAIIEETGWHGKAIRAPEA